MNFLILRRPRGGRLEGRTALIQVLLASASSVVNFADDGPQRQLWRMARLDPTIHVPDTGLSRARGGVDHRVKPGDDDGVTRWISI
jgi:hypothetical protein